MRRLSDTLERLARFKIPDTTFRGTSRLKRFDVHGPHAAGLKAYSFLPSTGLQGGAALVVVLHGCQQVAASYDDGSGWSRLAERHGFALLYPEQQPSNNPHRCFSWYDPLQTRRGWGQARAIQVMIAQMLHQNPRLDPRRVFVTGLSAGGAMAATMLASYPEVFAGGAILSGLPYAIASNVPQAFDRMRGQGIPASATELGSLIRNASRHEGPWPTISIWHGTSDQTVVPANADATLAQWLAVHGLATEASSSDTVDGHRRRTWRDMHGRATVEAYEIAGMGHGVAIDGPARVPYMLNAGISSTQRIAEFWGIAPAKAGRPA